LTGVGATAYGEIGVFRLGGAAGSVVSLNCTVRGATAILLPGAPDMVRVGLTVATNSARVFEGATSTRLQYDFVGIYAGVSEPESLGPTPIIHVVGTGSLGPGNYALTFREKSSAPSLWTTIPFNTDYSGFSVSVAQGEYEIWWRGLESGKDGQLRSEGAPTIVVGAGESSWGNVEVNTPSSAGGARKSGLSSGAETGIIIGVIFGVIVVIVVLVILRSTANADGYQRQGTR
jgi:hypothetical protein